MNNDYTIAQEYTLPSEGKVYTQNGDVKSRLKLRSMTTVEEMKRLNHSDRPNKLIAEIIDDCLLEDIGISAYDMCLPDFQYALHKLRVVTYGPEYKVQTTCPFCASSNEHVMNLEALNVTPFDEELFNKYSEFVLPLSKDTIKLRLQTPRLLDNVKLQSKEMKKKNPSGGEPSFLLTLESLIDTVNDKRMEKFKMPGYLSKLPMRDTNYSLKAAEKLNNSFGIDGEMFHTCNICGLDYTSNFRTTSEFFGPSID